MWRFVVAGTVNVCASPGVGRSRGARQLRSSPSKPGPTIGDSEVAIS